jgi:hypothetical protein
MMVARPLGYPVEQYCEEQVHCSTTSEEAQSSAVHCLLKPDHQIALRPHSSKLGPTGSSVEEFEAIYAGLNSGYGFALDLALHLASQLASAASARPQDISGRQGSSQQCAALNCAPCYAFRHATTLGFAPARRCSSQPASSQSLLESHIHGQSGTWGPACPLTRTHCLRRSKAQFILVSSR